MTNNIFQKLTLAAIGTALSLTVLEAHPAKAAIITYDFNVNLSGETGSGSFSYDPSIEFYIFGQRTKQLTSFTFSFLGKTYGLIDLQFFDRNNLVTSVGANGDQLLGDSFIIPFRLPQCSFPPDICNSNIEIINNIFYYNANTTGFPSIGSVTYSRVSPPTSVPEPSNSASEIGLLGLGLFLKKKIAPSSKQSV